MGRVAIRSNNAALFHDSPKRKGDSRGQMQSTGQTEIRLVRI